MTTFNWKDNFKNLPKLPKGKLWIENGEPGTATQEQIITNKLLHSHPINLMERQILAESIVFYGNLYSELERFDFAALSASELDEFLLYIAYAFNFLPMHTNDIELFYVYRLVNNSDGKTKTNKNQLSHPSLEFIRNRNQFNRGSSPNSIAFYSSDSVDVVFKELKPQKSSIVTLGIWSPKNKNKFLSYPIMANPSAQFVNENAKIASLAYSGLKNKIHPLFGHYIDSYFRLLNREYSKLVKDHKEYIISAHFSEKIFEIDDKGWNIDCIIYPSVGNEYINSNLAFKSSTADDHLYLRSALEYEILDTFYERPTINRDPATLSVAKVKILKRSKEILNNGDIIWT